MVCISDWQNFNSVKTHSVGKTRMLLEREQSKPIPRKGNQQHQVCVNIFSDQNFDPFFRKLLCSYSCKWVKLIYLQLCL